MDWKQQHDDETLTIEAHSHDLIHEFSKQLKSLRRYDQYIANSGNQPELQEFWRESKRQMESNLDQLSRLIKSHVNFSRFG